MFGAGSSSAASGLGASDGSGGGGGGGGGGKGKEPEPNGFQQWRAGVVAGVCEEGCSVRDEEGVGGCEVRQQKSGAEAR